jgi:hypothetical protein
LKKRTKKLWAFGVRGGAARTPTRKSFCFFLQKEGLQFPTMRMRAA